MYTKKNEVGLDSVLHTYVNVDPWNNFALLTMSCTIIQSRGIKGISQFLVISTTKLSQRPMDQVTY